MKVIVCGDRLPDAPRSLVLKELQRFHATYPISEIITASNPGVDAVATWFATQEGIKLSMVEYQYGRSVTLDMLDRNPNIVLAFHNDWISDSYVRRIIAVAEDRGIPVKVWNAFGQVVYEVA